MASPSRGPKASGRGSVQATLLAYACQAEHGARVGSQRWRIGTERRNMGFARRFTMTPDTTPLAGELSKLIDEQLELAAAKIPALMPAVVHPSPVDHEERQAPHATFEDVLLGNAVPTPEMLEEMAALEAAPELSEEELARQALADGGIDADSATPE
jgi:hypothetical protein